MFFQLDDNHYGVNKSCVTLCLQLLSFFLLASTNPLTNSANSRVNKPNLSLTDVLRCFLILFKSILSIFALHFFFEEQIRLKWTTNYKINKLSFKVAWEKASDVLRADWLNLNTWNIPVNHDMLRGTFSRLLFACSASIPAFLFICRSSPMTLH